MNYMKCLMGKEWLDVWGLLVGEAKKLGDLPMWLQYYPKTLFDTINRSGSGIISKQELRSEINPTLFKSK